MKMITEHAGKDVFNIQKDLDNLKSSLYTFLFTLRKMPEYEVKWGVRQNIEPQIRNIIRMLR